MLLSKQLLKNLQACDTGIAFCERNQLFGFDLDLLHTVTGDYHFFVSWLRDNLGENEFDNNENRIKRVNGSDQPTLWVYDDNRNLLSYTNGSIHELYTYNEFGKLSTFVDRTKSKTFKYDDDQNMVRFDSYMGQHHYWEEWTYSKTGKELTYLDSYKNQHVWTYDEHDNQVSQSTTRGVNGSIELIEATYDDKGRVASKTHNSGKEEYWEYDDMDNVLSYKEVYPDPNGEVYHLTQTFDSKGNRLTACWNGDGIERWVYDDHNNIVSYFTNDDPVDRFKNEYEYYPNGQLKRANGLHIPLIDKE
jgi:YD repeat-containing protein